MDDADQDSPLHTVLCSDNLNAIVVAVTFATLFLTSSALIFRSGRRLGFSPHVGGVSLTSPASQADSDAPTKDPKNSRSKERRRRGKDPLKEILKGGKKLKMTSFSRDHDIGSSTSASTSPFPESGSSQRSASISTSSRSVSVSSSNSAAAAGLTITDLAARDSDNGNATPSRKPSGRAHDASRPSAPDFEPPNGLRDISEVPEPPIPSNSSAESTSLTTPTTSPSVSPSENTSSGSTVLLHTYYSSDAQGTENPPPAPPKSSRPIIGSTAGGTPRRVSTPRRTPTPSSDGNASLNSQTQIASLREELEAAHMREEQAKADLDCCAKDCEMMHWENNTWRLREFELQAQINHLMHQLQTYAGLFASTLSPHFHMPNGSSPSSPNGHGPPSPNGYPGMFPSTEIGSPVMPFFAYPPPPPPPPNLFPIPFLMPSANGGSGSESGPSSSVSGSAESSVGSVSPDLVGSPGPLDRGRPRTRTEARWEGKIAEEWVGVEVQDAGHEGDAEDGEEDEYEGEDGGFSEALADAILKRPESMRVRSKKREKSGPTEFIFPSISDFGNIRAYKERHAESAVAEQEEEQLALALGDLKDDSEPVVAHES